MTRSTKLCILAFLFAICGVSALLQSHLEHRRQSVAPNTLYEVVWQQIRAFQAGDHASAYQRASTGFQEKFNIDAFAALARTEYPALLRAERVEFGAVRFEDKHAIVPVYFFLPDGDVIPCLYSLVNEDDVWKIDGAKIMRRWPAGRRLGGMRA
jgi:hypothetical protein